MNNLLRPLGRFIRAYSTDTQPIAIVRRGLEEYFEPGGNWHWRVEDIKTGRPWEVSQLRTKSFTDLHGLWWLCLKEVNKLNSQQIEANRFNVRFPREFEDRLTHVKKTMSRIKQVLGERKLSFEKATEIMKRENFKIRLMREYLAEQGVEVDGGLTMAELEEQVPQDKMREIMIKCMQTVPAPVLGNVASAVAIGLKPYGDGIIEIPAYRAKRMKMKERKEIRKHEATHFLL